MKTKHTPGPWEVKPSDKVGRLHVTGRINEVSEIVVCDTDNEANAKLIAAAPDMLEALLKVQTAIANWRDDVDSEMNLEEIKYLIIDPIIERATK